MIRSIASLEAAVSSKTSEDGRQWLENAKTVLGDDSRAIRRLFPAAGRHVGRGLLALSNAAAAWTSADGARVLLLYVAGEAAASHLQDLYYLGDSDERRAILWALPLLPLDDEGIPLVQDAIRTNDARLVAAALGPYALERLSEQSLAQAVLKCVFMGVSLTRIEGLADRTSPEMSRMLAGYVHERVAAGRTIPGDLWPIIDAHPPAEVLVAIEAELEHPVEDRRRAAAVALSQRTSPVSARA
jgi:hypothetical protein